MLMMVYSSGNEDKNASLELFMKTSNPTLILMTGTLFFSLNKTHCIFLSLLSLNN